MLSWIRVPSATGSRNSETRSRSRIKRRGAVATLRIGILFPLLKAGEFFAYPIAGVNFLRRVEYAQQLPRVRLSSAQTLGVRGGEELPEWHADQGKNFHVVAFDACEVTASPVP